MFFQKPPYLTKQEGCSEFLKGFPSVSKPNQRKVKPGVSFFQPWEGENSPSNPMLFFLALEKSRQDAPDRPPFIAQGLFSK
jgi:hypothetical protein